MTQERSCLDCPSRVPAEKVKAMFGKDFGPGVSVCMRHGHVLATARATAEEQVATAERFAKNCANYGEPKPLRAPHYVDARVMQYGDPEIMANPPDPSVQSQVSSCEGCANLIPATIVSTELGWDLPLCAASGRLLLERRFGNEPKSCGYAVPVHLSPRPRRNTTDGLQLRPEYGPVNRGSGSSGSGPAFIDPSKYETDREVTPEDEARGIRAWRKFRSQEDPARAEYAPIYRPDFFPEDEQEKIPVTGGEGHPEMYVDHQNLIYSFLFEMRKGETPLLIGDAGTGKTEAFRHLAWIMQVPFDRISVTKSTQVDDLIGHPEYDPSKGTWFSEGRLVKRWQKPGVLLIDEPNLGPPEVWELMRPLTDDAKQLVLDQAQGQRISRHPDCYFGMAANPDWDYKYIGAQPISAADANRLTGIWVDLPPEQVEREIIRARCEVEGYSIDEKLLDTIMSIARDIRQRTGHDGDLPISWAVRSNIKVAKKTEGYGLATAYRRAVTDALPPAQAEAILEIVRRYAI